MIPIRTFLSKKLIILIGLMATVIIFFIGKNLASSQNKQQYQTAQAQKGTLIVSLGESGSVAVSNRVSITTAASGSINNVYVKNGDTVTTGQKIADITLDTSGQQRQAQAYASYLQAQSSVNSANTQTYALHATMFTNWQTFTNLSENSTYTNGDGSPNVQNRTAPQFIEAQDNWLNAQAQYQQQQAVISQAQSSLSSAWLAYQNASATITSPTNGTISDLTITNGMQIGSANTSASGSNATLTAQTVASIKTAGNPVITVNLSEVDAAQITPEDKATITFDALPDSSFTGKVIGINTTGNVSSGVTTYPATIVLDSGDDHILPNMSATANIITQIKDNVLLVPNAAVQTANGSLYVRVLKNGQIIQTPVETGSKSDSQTEIVSGLSQGQIVVTSFISQTTQTTVGTSPFSGGLRFGGFGGGGFGAGARGGGGTGGR